MSAEPLDELFQTFLHLEEIDVNIYRSTHQLAGRRDGDRVYGGQVVGQALMAATQTIDANVFHPHAIHCQFLAPATVKRPIVYDINRTLDGRSFSSRTVRAVQNGKCLFTSMISFQRSEPDSIRHQTPMPVLPPPEECEDSKDFFHRLLHQPETVSPEGKRVVVAYRQVLDLPDVFKVKFITPREYINVPLNKPIKCAIWVRSNASIGPSKELHHCVAAFISDVAPVGTPLFAHAGAGFRLGMAASLDHSMWIHDFDFTVDNDWLLYETVSTIAGGGRALIHGKMWTRDGRMVLSTAQEILIRSEKPRIPRNYFTVDEENDAPLSE